MFNPMLDVWASMARSSTWDALPFGFGLVPLAPSQPAAVGNFIDDRYLADIGSLRYKLFIPSCYDGAPLPLLLMLHGCGQDADDFACGTGMNALAEKSGCLVAYPEQSCGANGNKCWNWFDAAHHQRGQGEPALIAGVAQKIMSDYAVDAARVFVAGLSSGGSMAVILGRSYPELFSAVGCHSGLAHGSATDCFGALQAMRQGAGGEARDGAAGFRRIPIIVFHGDLDATVHPSNGDSVLRQSIVDPRARAVAQLDASQETGQATGRSYTRDIHRSKCGAIVAEQWTVHGGGHAWSGGNGRGSYTDAAGPAASEEMLRFFIQRELA